MSTDRGALIPAHGILLPDGRPVEQKKICGYYMSRQICKFGKKCESAGSQGITTKELKESYFGSTTREDRKPR